jgi:hypothetical protein
MESLRGLKMTSEQSILEVFDFSIEERAEFARREFELEAEAQQAEEEWQRIMSNINQILEDAMRIDGAIGAALVDWKSGMCLGTAGGGGFNLEIAAAGNTDLVRSKLKAMQNLGLRDHIEDILISLGSQYHLIRMLSEHSDLFLYLVLNRSQANLAMARYKLTQLDQVLKL